MGLGLWLGMRFLDVYVLDTTRTVALIMLTVVVSSVGMGLYFGLAWLMHIPELKDYVALFAKIGNWRSVLISQEEVLEQPSQAQEIKPL